jgi:hypothetical protein
VKPNDAHRGDLLDEAARPMKLSISGWAMLVPISGACLAKVGHQIMALTSIPEKLRLINSGLSPIVEPGFESSRRARRVRIGGDLWRNVAAKMLECLDRKSCAGA